MYLLTIISLFINFINYQESIMSKYIISISKDLLTNISETDQFPSEYKYDVVSYIDLVLKKLPAAMEQTQLELKLKEIVLKYLSKYDFDIIQESYLDEQGVDVINVMSPEYIVSFLRSNPESSIALDAEVFYY